jgi:parallel beta-helix repeat protein
MTMTGDRGEMGNGGFIHTRAARRGVAAGAVVAATLLAAVSGAPGAMAAAGAAPGAPVPASTVIPVPPTISQANANNEAAVVAAEDRRLIQVRAVIGAARNKGSEWESPFRLATGTGYTLVLTPRSAPYTVADLLVLAPDTFLREPDGSYLLLENLYVTAGATLNLSSAGGLVLHMASNADGFTSIISFGGSLQFSGTADSPMTISSWDPRTNQPDTNPVDGRAYIRTVGGTFSMTYVNVRDLGFWSGRTGGIGLTGTDRPTTGSTSGPSAYNGAHGKTAKEAQKDSGAAKPQDNPGADGVTGQPAGPLGTPDTQFSVPGMSYVSVSISHCLITGNAFGLFIAGATGISVNDVAVSGSLVAGIELQRYASQGVLSQVTSSNNDGDGIVVSRAAQQIQITDSSSDYNAGNGFTVNGQPISDGPSASGEPMGSYGNNTISSSTAQDNSHYGIEVLGGLNTAIDNNVIIGNQMGIVVRRASQSVVITGNQLKQQDREGISIRDGVQGATINSNIIQGAATGIYVRASTAQILGNTITGATIHGVTLVGADGGTVINANTMTGSGPGAISSYRATGKSSITGNQTSAWFDTTSVWRKIRALIRPLTIIWAGIFTLIAITALRGRRLRKGTGKRNAQRRAQLTLGAHPYSLQAPLALPPTTRFLERERPALHTDDYPTLIGRRQW